MTRDLLPEDVARSIAEQIDALAEQVGSAEWRFAARLLRGEAKPGRKQRDDDAALAQVRVLLARDCPRWKALNIVAKRVAPHNPRAAIRRLGLKLKKEGR